MILAHEVAGPAGRGGTAGVGDTTPVVLAHGFSLHRAMWRDDVAPLARRGRVVTYDLRGFGASPPPASGVRYSHVEDLVALLDGLGIERAHLIGHSFGGQQMIETALAAPSRVASLTLVGTGLRGVPADPAFAEMFARVRAAARGEGVEAARAIWLANPMFDLPRALGTAGSLPLEVAGEYHGWHWLFDDPAGYDPVPPTERLAELRLPLHVVVGNEDGPTAQRAAELLVTGVEDVQVTRIAGAAHFPNVERPGAFRSAVLGFLDGLGASAPTGRS